MADSKTELFDVVVIGGGTAGLVTASGCARLGRKVALIERDALGGDCLWTGCVPTKALIATAKLAYQMAHADAYGLQPVRQPVDSKKVMDSMRAMQKDISRHDDPEKFRKLGIDVIFGQARLISRSQVQAGERTLEAKDIVLATGARTNVPPIQGLAETGFFDHVSFLDQDSLPRSVVILGGGYIGIEFAQLFRRLGVEVTVVEMLDEIINKEDADVIRAVRQLMNDEGISVRTGWTATKVRKEEGRRVVSIASKDGQTESVAAEWIFVASGRRGNTENLGLEEAGVKVERSWVVVDAHLQTTVPRIWAGGDIHGGLQFTHVAAYEAIKLVRNILFPGMSAVDYQHIPWAVYTDPEIGHIGLTEDEAVRKFGQDQIRTFRVEMADVDRAVVDRVPRGFIKFVTDPKGTILGAHAFCASASSLIEEIVLARKKRAKISELAQLVSPYPSLADAIQKAAAGYYQDLSTSWLGRVGGKIAAWTQ